MSEVFSISGFGQPDGWELTPKGNYGAPTAGCPTNLRVGDSCRHPSAIRLQKALGVKADGFIGPQTTAAVNAALGTELAPEEVAGRADALAVRLLEKGIKPAPPKKKKAKNGAAAPAPLAPTSVRRLRTGGAIALMGLSAVAAGVGGWFAWGSR